MQLIEKARGQGKKINVTSNKKPRCLLHYGMLAKVLEEKRYCNLKKLVDLGADREQRDEHGRTPLHLAVLLGDTKAVDVLLEAGCDTTAKCHGNNLMHLATISGDPDMLHKVQELGFNPCSPTEYGFTTVHLAALYNQHQLVPLLKRYGVDVNRCSEAEATALCLHQAVIMLGFKTFRSYVLQNLKCQATRTTIACIINYCSDVEAQAYVQQLCKSEYHNEKVHPLICATMLGFSQTVKVLVDLGADTTCLFGNLSLLHWSAAIGHLELVKYFFKCKGESSEHIHLISLAVLFGAGDVVEFLVENNNENKLVLDSPDSEFDSANLVDIAAIMNRPGILKFALEMEYKGVLERSILCKDPNKILLAVLMFALIMNVLAKTIPAFTPVLAVTKERQSQVVSTILDIPGCDPLQAISTEGNVAFTLLHISIFLSQPVAVDVILNNLKQKKGILPSHTAISIPGFEGFLPFFHACVLSAFFVASLLQEKFRMNYIIDDLINTFDVLVKHSYDMNILDCDGRTCLDYAIALEFTDMVDPLHSRGAYTAGEALQKTLKDVEHLKDAKEKISSDKQTLEVENKKLKSELGLLEKLVEEKMELAVENQVLKLQNENLSRKLDVFLKQLSPLSSFLNPVSNPPTQQVTTPSPSMPVGMMSSPIPDTTRTDPLLTTPTLNQLNRLIIRQVALGWHSVGLHLEMENLTLKIIEADVYPPSVEKCCRTMFSKWLSHDEGTGSALRIWRTVLKALKEAGYSTLVGDVERVLFEQNQ